MNRDGHIDVVAGPFIYYGPDFTEAREIYAAQTYSPSTTFAHNWVAFAGDFTGDGWPDVLLASTDNNRLYVNPKGEADAGICSRHHSAREAVGAVGDEGHRRRRQAGVDLR